MPTFENPAADADEVQQALSGLAHATRSIHDPRQIYSALGSLTSAVASPSQALHQIASLHDGPARKTAWVYGDSRTVRAAAYQVSWELHRSDEMRRHVADAIGHAHEAEATTVYDHRDLPSATDAPCPSANYGLRL